MIFKLMKKRKNNSHKKKMKMKMKTIENNLFNALQENMEHH